MKNLFRIIGGIALIGLGALLLIRPDRLFFELNPVLALFGFLVLACGSLAIYLTAGHREWGWLFPVGVFGGLACIVGSSMLGISNPMMVIPLFAGIAMPFVVTYLQNRDERWWAIIPAGVMVFLIFVMFLTGIHLDDWIGSVLFFVLAATFGVIFLLRKAKWALIVTYIMFVMGFVPMLGMSAHPENTGILILAAVSVPFFMVYFNDPVTKWWAIIPAGINLSAAITVGVVFAIPMLSGIQISNAIMLLGVAATFGFVWLRHQKRWASIVAMIAMVFAAVQYLIGENFMNRWPIFVLALGIILLIRAFLPEKKAVITDQQTPMEE